MIDRIIDLTRQQEMYIQQCAEIIHLAFRENWVNAWSTIEDGLEEVHEMLADDRILRIALSPENRVLGWIGGIPEYDGNVWELHPLAVPP